MNTTTCRTSVRLLAVLLAALMATGCASMSDSQTTTAQGAAMGSLLGAVAGGVIGHQSGNRTTGILVGGLVGAAAGATYGSHVAGKKAEFASQEDYLDAVLAEAVQVRDEAVRQNEALHAEIAALEQQVNETLAAQATEEDSRTNALALKSELEQKLAGARSGLQGVTDEIRIQREVLSAEAESMDQGRLETLEQTIAELESQKAELTSQVDQLADLGSRISV